MKNSSTSLAKDAVRRGWNTNLIHLLLLYVPLCPRYLQRERTVLWSSSLSSLLMLWLADISLGEWWGTLQPLFSSWWKSSQGNIWDSNYFSSEVKANFLENSVSPVQAIQEELSSFKKTIPVGLKLGNEDVIFSGHKLEPSSSQTGKCESRGVRVLRATDVAATETRAAVLW